MPWFFDALQDCGYRYDSSIFWQTEAHGGWADFDKECPLESFIVGSWEIRVAATIMGRSVFWSGGSYQNNTAMASQNPRTKNRRTLSSTYIRATLTLVSPSYRLPLIRHFKYYAGIKLKCAEIQKIFSDI